MKGKVTAVLFIIVFLLILAVVFTFLTGNDRQPEEAPLPEGTPVINLVDPKPTSIIEVPANTPVQTPAATNPPDISPIQTPAPTLEPSPEPTLEPVPAQTALGSGSFASESGAKLNIRAEWSAVSLGGNQAQVTVKVILDSYSLHLNAVPDSVKLSLDGQYVSLDAPAVDYDGSSLLSTTLSEKTFTVNLSDSGSTELSLAVEWHFGGTYGGVEIPTIECGGTISLSK